MSSLTPLQGTLGTRRAAHLLRRLSFRFTKERIAELANMSASAAVDALLTPVPFELEQPIWDDIDTPDVENITWINPPGTALPAGTQDASFRRWVTTWWLNEALKDPGATHKLTFFFHQYNIVTITAAKTPNVFDHLALLRWATYGNWKNFAKKLVLDNTMLRYLNNNSNTATNPQENFAREFLELFTIGKGEQAGPGDYTNYTEDDIVAAAKVLTGCRTQVDRTIIDSETGLPKGQYSTSAHNWTEKVFSVRLQNLTIPAVTVNSQKTAAKMDEELSAFINRIFEQDETARNFCRRLYRFFVNEKITSEIENDIIVPLANDFKNGGYEIKPILQKLFKSQHFFGEDNTTSVENFIGGIIRSPLDMALHSISMFNTPIPSGTANPLTRFRFFSQGMVDRMLALGGMPIFQASDVAGYPAYYQYPDYSHQWFNSTTLIARYRLGTMLLSGKLTIGNINTANSSLGTKVNIAAWTRSSGFFTAPSDPYLLVLELLEIMLPKEVDDARFNYFYQDVFLDNLPPADWTYEWDNYINTNIDTEVTLALERLVKAIMYSQEYQTA
jgi:uncharacterized protein (DUF1800 family)